MYARTPLSLAALALCASLPWGAAFAQEAAPADETAETAQTAEKKVVNWDDARQKQFADAGFAGELKAFGPSGVSVIIPNDYTQAGLTDESAAAGTLAAFAKPTVP